MRELEAVKMGGVIAGRGATRHLRSCNSAVRIAVICFFDRVSR